MDHVSKPRIDNTNIHCIAQLISEGKVDEVDKSSLMNWIMCTAESMATSTWKTLKLITSTTNSNLQQLTNHKAKLIKDINSIIASTRKSTMDTKTECQDMVKELCKEVILTTNKVDNSTISAIKSINFIANSHKDQLIVLNNDAKKVINKLNAIKTIGTESNN